MVLTAPPRRQRRGDAGRPRRRAPATACRPSRAWMSWHARASCPWAGHAAAVPPARPLPARPIGVAAPRPLRQRRRGCLKESCAGTSLVGGRFGCGCCAGGSSSSSSRSGGGGGGDRHCSGRERQWASSVLLLEPPRGHVAAGDGPADQAGQPCRRGCIRLVHGGRVGTHERHSLRPGVPHCAAQPWSPLFSTGATGGGTGAAAAPGLQQRAPRICATQTLRTRNAHSQQLSVHGSAATLHLQDAARLSLPEPSRAPERFLFSPSFYLDRYWDCCAHLRSSARPLSGPR